MNTKVKKVFDKWVKFMNDNGPMGEDYDRLCTDDFRVLRDMINKELAQLDEDDANFNCGAM